jgi:3-oxoacyl-(acyl-carrier-protein) synthase
MNYWNADPDLDFVPNQARPMKGDYALRNSFGFSGTRFARTSAVLIFKTFHGVT